MNDDTFTEITHSGGNGLVLPRGLFNLENFRWILGEMYIMKVFYRGKKKKSTYQVILILSGHLLDCSQIANE